MLSPLFGLLLAFALVGFTEALNLTIGSGPGNASSPLLYGLLFEVYSSLSLFERLCLIADNFIGCLPLRRWRPVRRADPESGLPRYDREC
jgi:hypothetical protein